MVFILRLVVAQMLLIPGAMKLAAGYHPNLTYPEQVYYAIAVVEIVVSVGVAMTRKWQVFAWAAVLIGGFILVLALLAPSTADCGCFGKAAVTSEFRAIYGACLGLLASWAIRCNQSPGGSG